MPGTYALVMRAKAPVTIRVSRLGNIEFPAGYYIYFGSALGPGGLQARIGHHARITPKPRWHLDYLRPFIELEACHFSTGNTRLECIWTQKILAENSDCRPVTNFGSSDCRSGCLAHLVGLNRSGDPIDRVTRVLGSIGQFILLDSQPSAHEEGRTNPGNWGI